MLRRLGNHVVRGWPDSRLSRWKYVLGVCGVLVLLALIPAAVAQSTRRPASDLQAATRALHEGRYDDVSAIAQKLNGQDPDVVALVAQADIARGRYEQAEARLRPVAERAPRSAAALELGLLLRMLGRAEAPAVLRRVASAAATTSDPRELARGARALRALGAFQEANAAYRDAAGAAPGDIAIETAWGELFLEKYEKGEALKSFQTVLEQDENWVPAVLGSARVLADDNPPQSVQLAERALAINPSSVDARLLLAEHAVDAGKRDEARELLLKALSVNPSSLEAHAMLAGLAYVEDKTSEFEESIAKALAVAPSYGEAYRVAGELAAANYRFDEAAALTRRALELDPDNPQSLADLGVHLLRTGDEPGARRALEASFKLDGFNRVTFNLLQMMDTLDTFVTLEQGDIVFRMDKAEAPVMQEYAVPLAQRALSTLSERYQFKPQGPILVEMFPRHDDFAVRNVGVPGMIGALGACFGRVVTLDSPKARPPGDFQWEATLWHEMAHVITLQMSRQRLPRWLSEGISTYEEKLANPEWARAQDLDFAVMLERDEVMPLRDLNSAFTDPRKISIAYFQASLLVDHIVKTYGDQGLHRLLRAYGEGLDTEAALAKALDTDYDELQAGFDETVEPQFASLRAALRGPEPEKLAKMSLDELRAVAEENARSFPFQMAYGGALRKAGQDDEAMRAFEQAASLIPIAGGPYVQMAEIAIERKDPLRAIAALERLMGADAENVEAPRQLVKLMAEQKITDAPRLMRAYQRIASVDPFDADAHRALGRFALDRGDSETAIREFKAVIALGPVDQAAAHTDLAESYLKGGRRADARKQTLAALEIAPSYQRAQELLLKISEGQ
jgi:tetratricopeptide (TPR) repeat protein